MPASREGQEMIMRMKAYTLEPNVQDGRFAHAASVTLTLSLAIGTLSLAIGTGTTSACERYILAATLAARARLPLRRRTVSKAPAPPRAPFPLRDAGRGTLPTAP